MFDSGISYEGDLLDLALAEDVIQRSGAWINYGDLRLGQGRENAKKYLLENAELAEEIKNKILVAKGLAEA
jgi:recombination protein RecA